MGNPIQNHRHNIINFLREARNAAPTEKVRALYYTVKPMLKGRQGMQKDEQIATLTAVRDMLIAFDVDSAEFAEITESRTAERIEQRDAMQAQVEYLLEQIAALDAQIAAPTEADALAMQVTAFVEQATAESLLAVELATGRDFDAYIEEKRGYSEQAESDYDDDDEDDDDEDGM